MPEARNNRESSNSPDESDSPTELDKPSWMGVLKRSIKGYKTDNLSDWAAALTYRGVLCLAPALLVVVSIVGLLGSSATSTLLNNVGSLAPGGVQTVPRQVVTDAQHRGAAGLAGLIGLALALWSASGYIAAFMRASNAIYEVGEGRPVWKTIPIRLGVTIVMVILVVISAAIVVVSGPLAQDVGNALGLGNTAVLTFEIVKWPVLVLIVGLMLAILYYAAPNARQPGFQWVSPGGLVAVVIWVVASAAFAFYVANFGSYNKTYGSLATVVIFLVWLWITNLAILFGTEFNAEMQRAKVIESDGQEAGDAFPEPRDTRKLNDEEEDKATALSPRQER
jgi:membrane protein